MKTIFKNELNKYNCPNSFIECEIKKWEVAHVNFVLFCIFVHVQDKTFKETESTF